MPSSADHPSLSATTTRTGVAVCSERFVEPDRSHRLPGLNEEFDKISMERNLRPTRQEGADRQRAKQNGFIDPNNETEEAKSKSYRERKVAWLDSLG
jgi:hypothetical protein